VFVKKKLEKGNLLRTFRKFVGRSHTFGEEEGGKAKKWPVMRFVSSSTIQKQQASVSVSSNFRMCPFDIEGINHYEFVSPKRDKQAIYLQVLE
jgi:hypothetical protein